MEKLTYQAIWENLRTVDVSGMVEQKMGLTYLSWAHAWGALMEEYPQATYEFHPHEVDERGYVEIWCTVKIGECSRTMWLPVMNNRNQAIAGPDARAISDTRMRCLVKCLAMFGLGHKIYCGEDVNPPEQPSAPPPQQQRTAPPQQQRTAPPPPPKPEPQAVTQEAAANTVVIDGKTYSPMATCGEITACKTMQDLDLWKSQNMNALKQMKSKSEKLDGIIRAAFAQRKADLEDDIPF